MSGFAAQIDKIYFQLKTNVTSEGEGGGMQAGGEEGRRGKKGSGLHYPFWRARQTFNILLAACFMCDSQFDNKSKDGRRISSISNKIFTIFLWQGNNGGGGRGVMRSERTIVGTAWTRAATLKPQRMPR